MFIYLSIYCQKAHQHTNNVCVCEKTELIGCSTVADANDASLHSERHPFDQNHQTIVLTRSSKHQSHGRGGTLRRGIPPCLEVEAEETRAVTQCCHGALHRHCISKTWDNFQSHQLQSKQLRASLLALRSSENGMSFGHRLFLHSATPLGCHSVIRPMTATEAQSVMNNAQCTHWNRAVMTD